MAQGKRPAAPPPSPWGRWVVILGVLVAVALVAWLVARPSAEESAEGEPEGGRGRGGHDRRVQRLPVPALQDVPRGDLPGAEEPLRGSGALGFRQPLLSGRAPAGGGGGDRRGGGRGGGESLWGSPPTPSEPRTAQRKES